MAQQVEIDLVQSELALQSGDYYEVAEMFSRMVEYRSKQNSLRNWDLRRPYMYEDEVADLCGALDSKLADLENLRDKEAQENFIGSLKHLALRLEELSADADLSDWKWDDHFHGWKRGATIWIWDWVTMDWVEYNWKRKTNKWVEYQYPITY